MENKRFKRGALWTVITAGILIAVILFNILFTFLANKFLWVIDTMPNDLIKISDYSRELLDQIDPEANDIKIYFLADPDELENYELKGHVKGESDSTWGMSYIYNLARYYESEYSFITVDLLDTSEDADFIRERFAMTIGSSLTPLTVILENTVEDRVSYRTVARDDFFAISDDLMYFRGDDRFTSTILSLSGESPIAYFVEGHGEKVGPLGVSDDLGEAEALADLFREAGYIIKKINLSDEDFAATSSDIVEGGASTVVIYGPTSDFLVGEEGGVNEITRLRKFINQKNHHLMVFVDPETDDMPHLDEYLEDYWGVAFEDNIILADTEDLLKTPAISEDGRSFLAAYELDSSSPGSALTSSMTTLETLPGAFFGSSRSIAMKKSWSNNQESTLIQEGSTTYKLGAVFRAPALSAAVYENGAGFKVFDEALYDRYLAQYYQSKYDEIYAEYSSLYYQSYYDNYYEASLEDFEDEGLSADEIANKCDEYAKTCVLEHVTFFMNEYLSLNVSDASALMTLTHGTWYYSRNETVNTFLLACGSTAYASEEALTNAAYSNRDTLYSAVYLFGKNVLPYDIDIIQIVDDSSLAITDTMATVWTILLSAVLPLLFVGAGVCVMIRRRKHN